MPVPKRKTSKARRDQRHANRGLEVTPFNLCFNGPCKGEPVMPHTICKKCGFYRGRQVIAGSQKAAPSTTQVQE